MTGWRLEHTYAELPRLFYSDAAPTPVPEPRLVVFNNALAEMLGLDPVILNSPEGARNFATLCSQGHDTALTAAAAYRSASNAGSRTGTLL